MFVRACVCVCVRACMCSFYKPILQMIFKVMRSMN